MKTKLKWLLGAAGTAGIAYVGYQYGPQAGQAARVLCASLGVCS